MLHLQWAYVGRREFRGFLGSETVAWITELNGFYYSRILGSDKIVAYRAMPDLRAAKTLVYMVLSRRRKNAEV